MVHEGGFAIALVGAGDVEVRTPAGTLLPAAPALAPDDGAVEWNGDWWTARDGFATPVPTGDGEPVDYDWIVSTLTDSGGPSPPLT